jgi:post-segregation antitoxin (ccd killing protein)
MAHTIQSILIGRCFVHHILDYSTKQARDKRDPLGLNMSAPETATATNEAEKPLTGTASWTEEDFIAALARLEDVQAQVLLPFSLRSYELIALR